MTGLPPKKIELLFPRLNLGGAERVAFNLTAAFKELVVITWLALPQFSRQILLSNLNEKNANAKS